MFIKEYFPATLVNADAKRYELAKIAYDNDSYSNDTDPITQSHGDFYSACLLYTSRKLPDYPPRLKGYSG